MSELTLQILRIGFLVLLWVFVVSVLAVLRRDVFGTQVQRRRSGAAVIRSPQIPFNATAESAPLRTLVVTDGSLRGTTLALGQATIVIGRAPESTLVLEDDYASTHHARVYSEDGQWLVEDLGSTNGTYVGRVRVEEPTPLDAGMAVRVGRTVFELRR
jgi:pSer/pThr/pTyr-binding forkhead associated (FHA) protein